MTSNVLPDRDAVDNGAKWDLSSLFGADGEWEALYSDIEKKIGQYSIYKGNLGTSLDLFKEAIEFDLDISRNLEKIYTYAHLKSDEDSTNQQYVALHQRAINLYSRISEASSFFTPEIQSLPDDVLATYKNDPGMRDFRFYLEKIIRYKPHTKSKEIEEVLAMSNDLAHAPAEAFSKLENADLKFGFVENKKGERVELTHGNFNSFLINHDREIRRKAFNQYYSVYNDHRHTIATTLAYANKKDNFYSRVRNFKDARGSALFADNVPDSVYDNLIETVKNNSKPLFNYLELRKEILGLDQLHFYDTYVPLVKDIDFNMSYEQAADICLQALAPLGSEYCSILKDGLYGGWVDRYENRGKRSGAYSSGCYDSDPFILLNYQDDNINSLFTLIHEAGHSMHTYYSVKHQPYVSHAYTIFVAEVASTFNETLLSSYLLDLYKDDTRMQAYLLNREIDNIRATLFRQTMFAEFEKLTHAIVEENKPLTLDVMRAVYQDLLGSYFGGKMVIDEELTLECLRIPHFYSAFYVYKYATGISAALALAKKVMDNEPGACEKYLDFLKLGGSKFPIEELIDAGIDMTHSQPVKDAIDHFAVLVDRFSTVYKELS